MHGSECPQGTGNGAHAVHPRLVGGPFRDNCVMKGACDAIRIPKPLLCLTRIVSSELREGKSEEGRYKIWPENWKKCGL